MMLPDELEWVLKMLGYNWPTANEDLLRDSADLWRKFGDDAQKLRIRADTSARTVVAHNAGESIDKFTTHYKKFSDGSDGYLAKASEAAYIIANAFEAAAYVVEFAKYAIIVQLIALAIQIAAAAAAAVVTFGLSAAAGMAATQITRLAVRRILDALKDALIQAVIEMMKEPAVSAVQAMVTDLVTQSVNVGFGTQEGFDLSKTVKAGVKGGWEAIQQSPQTFAEGLRDGLGRKAGSSVRDGIDSGYNHSMDAYNNRSNSGNDGGNSSGNGDNSGNTSSSNGSNSSSSSSSSNSNASGSNSSSSNSSNSSDSSGSSNSSSSDSSTTSRSAPNTGNTNIGGGISADSDDPGTYNAPDLGNRPNTDTGSGNPDSSPSSSDSGQNPSSSNSPSRPTLSDFDDPAPSNTSPSPSPDTSSNTPSAGDTRGGSSSPGGLSSPTPQSAPTPTGSSTPSSTGSNGGISTTIDSLAASIPTQSNAAPTPTTADPSTTAGPRPDGNSSMPTSPTPPSTADGAAGARTGTNTAPSGIPSSTTPTSPNPTQGPPRTPSTTPSIPNPTGAPASTPSPTPSTPPRSTPTPTTDSRTPGTPDTRTPNPNPNPNQPAPGTTPGRTTNPSTPNPTPDRSPTPRATTPNTSTPGTADTRTPTTNTNTASATPHTNRPESTTPNQDQRQPAPPRTTQPPAGTPTATPSPNASDTNAPGRTPDRTSTPNSNTPSTPNQPGGTPSPNPGNRPQQPGSQPNTPQNTQPSPANTPNTPNHQQQQQATAVPIHTVTPAPNGHTTQPTPQTTNTTPPTQQPGQKDTAKPTTPTPVSATRNNTQPGGVTDPTRAEQDALDNSVPRDENGDPTRPPDPADGSWVQNINGDGPGTPGRNNNCVDTALSTVDTYAGNPTAAGARTPDHDANGNPSDRGEKGGRDRIENTLGARFSDMGNGRDAFNNLENTLRNNGHGSQAVIITQDANGRAHAWNAVNHNGKITYIDAQTGRTSPSPLHSGNNGVFAIPLDSNRQPVTPNGQSRSDGAGRPGHETPNTPTGNRRPSADPAGAGNPDGHKTKEEKAAEREKERKKAKAEKARRLRERAAEVPNAPLDSEGPEGSPGYGVPQQGDGTSVHHGMLGDESQDLLRVTNELNQVDLHAIAQHLHAWAEGNPSPLRETIREATSTGRLTQDRLNQLLSPGFAEMSREDKAATVAAIARLSSTFHDAHAVDDSGGADLHSRHNPTTGARTTPQRIADAYAAAQNIAQQIGDNPSDEEAAKERGRFRSLWRKHVGDDKALSEAIAKAESEGKPEAEIEAMREEQRQRRMMRPDFSGKNFAALEVIERKPDGTTETHYIIDSSNPPLDHSEPVLGEAFRALDEANPGRYETSLMYTEFEPCGNRTEPSNANCADYLAHEFERPAGEEKKNYSEKSEEERSAIPEQKNRTKIVYGAGYRMGDLTPEEMAELQNSDKFQAMSDEQKEKAIADRKKEAAEKRNTDMDRFRGELARVWMKLAASADVP